MLSSFCGLIWWRAPLLALTESWGPGLGSGLRLAERLLPSMARGHLLRAALLSVPSSGHWSYSHWPARLTGCVGALALGPPHAPHSPWPEVHRPARHEAAGGAVAVCHLWALCLACSCPRPDPGNWPGCRLPLGFLHHAYHQILCSPPARWPSAPQPPPRLAQLPSPPHCFQILPQGHPPMAPVALRLTPRRGPVRFTVPPPTFQGVVFLCSWMNFPAPHPATCTHGPSACLLSPRVSCPCQHLFTL